MQTRKRNTLRILGAYYLVTGIWPVVWYRGFLAITGHKRDDWLVKTFGLVLAAFGVATYAGARAATPAIGPAVAVAGALATAESWYVLRGRLRPVYLADALLEAAVVARLLGRSRG